MTTYTIFAGVNGAGKSIIRHMKTVSILLI